MRKPEIIIITIILCAIAALLVYQYVFSIYEVTYSVNPKQLYADNLSTVTISIVPLNSFGKEAPFRDSSGKFEITEGRDLVDIVSMDENKGILILKAKNTTGKVAVKIRSRNALLPSAVEIAIYPNIT